jgi:hypothetical protein
VDRAGQASECSSLMPDRVYSYLLWNDENDCERLGVTMVYPDFRLRCRSTLTGLSNSFTRQVWVVNADRTPPNLRNPIKPKLCIYF